MSLTKLENAENYCRTCTSKDDNLLPIFSKVAVQNQEIEVKKLLFQYTFIEVVEDDYLPKQICTTCFEKLCETYLFVEKCQKSNDYFLASVGSYKKIEELEDDNEHLGQETDYVEALLKENESVKDSDSIKSDIDDAAETFNGTEEPREDITEDNTEFTMSKKDETSKPSTNVVEEKEEFRIINGEASNFISQKDQEEILKESTNEIQIIQADEIETEDGKRFICPICLRSFVNKYAMRKHYKIHTDARERLTCEVCSKVFSRELDVKRHMSKHTKQKAHQCTECGSAFTQNASLRRHLKIIHKQDLPNLTKVAKKEHLCPLCGTICKTSGQLAIHVRRHTGDKPHACELCPKRFYSGHLLKDHIRTHTGERPFSCNLCEKSFAAQSSLMRHLEFIHTKFGSDHRCKVCGKNFKSNDRLVNHLITHEDERQFECPQCPKAFNHFASLKQHVHLHDINNKQYQCNLCEKKFKKKQHFYLHEYAIHREKHRFPDSDLIVESEEVVDQDENEDTVEVALSTTENLVEMLEAKEKMEELVEEHLKN